MSKYTKFINKIKKQIANGTRVEEDYMEIHHIIPKCMGGTNDPENLIRLTGAEHYEAHRLLYKENPHSSELAYAWHMMANRFRQFIDADEYAELRSVLSKIQSEDFAGEKHPLYLVPESDETRKKISENHYDNSGENHPLYGKEKTQQTIDKQKSHMLHQKILCVETGIIYNSYTDAANSVNGFATNIQHACSGVTYTSYGYHWENLGRYYILVGQYDMHTNELIATYNTLKEAADAVGGFNSNISHCCSGEAYSAYGYCWHYIETEDK